MPTYDYQCQKCGHEFEFFQSMNDERLTDCPLENCNGKVKRLLGTGAGIIFKGSGFYETDYKRGDSYKAAAKADSAPSESGGGDSTGGGSDSSTSTSKKTKQTSSNGSKSAD